MSSRKTARSSSWLRSSRSCVRGTCRRGRPSRQQPLLATAARAAAIVATARGFAATRVATATRLRSSRSHGYGTCRRGRPAGSNPCGSHSSSSSCRRSRTRLRSRKSFFAAARITTAAGFAATATVVAAQAAHQTAQTQQPPPQPQLEQQLSSQPQDASSQQHDFSQQLQLASEQHPQPPPSIRSSKQQAPKLGLARAMLIMSAPNKFHFIEHRLLIVEFPLAESVPTSGNARCRPTPD